MHRFLDQLVAALLYLLSFDVSVGAEAGCDTPDIDFTEMSPSALPFVREIPVAIQAVCEWWGPTYNGPFHIVVNNVLRQSMALVPAWYGKIGYIFFPDSVVYLNRGQNRGRAATVHEVTHVFAPNANRFLAEGLAVYAHEYLKGPPAYPNFGADIKVLARKYADKADIGSLDNTATPTPLRFSSNKLEEREIYVVAGSFVGYLISEFGLSKFRELYALTPLIPGSRSAGDPKRWEEVYGLTIDRLASRWHADLNVH
jgi:hypothetical protein